MEEHVGQRFLVVSLPIPEVFLNLPVLDQVSMLILWYILWTPYGGFSNPVVKVKTVLWFSSRRLDEGLFYLVWIKIYVCVSLGL